MVRIFPNRESCLRLVTALAMEQSEEWITGRRYLDMEELGEQRRIEELIVESEEAMIMESYGNEEAWTKLTEILGIDQVPRGLADGRTLLLCRGGLGAGG